MPPRLNFNCSRALFRRNLTTTRTRLNTGMPPHPPTQQPETSAYKEGMSRYKVFASPFAKVFLGAVFTYQVIYWTWVKLEMEEVKVEKNQQLAALETEARELTGTGKK
ncbi:hypothetical protein AN1439.2 [Aspergillus nidulans FGSC A4]|uniref:Uncharacterized protein n=1 Tax=Emericella nidulans (strain FGSC A4 / ATCC 38163 / CBS 112.46 / NRRL 194 / M139) TaxID=227321 RepID=Q5BDE1_EMENI|nr:hypothetical protein [Aspergillus nidulans FGSC A4]EAA64569.1 hypothetical protein AN1439.2 [Aspergillus nidulans FGSC A4]CBF84860.1 TPA: hypothetical protein ANIA_01439 [Aspergillus nidulans FGSC A4]|eukprot:XP_659043.1 hypothetical protein AN1439.2 [Aspergillus nidulans FGSC A4]